MEERFPGALLLSRGIVAVGRRSLLSGNHSAVQDGTGRGFTEEAAAEKAEMRNTYNRSPRS